MNSPNTLTPSDTHSYDLEGARSALAFYLDRSVTAIPASSTTNDGSPLRLREELVEVRRVLDAHGPLRVPAVVVADAAEYWQARHDEAEALLLSRVSEGTSKCFIEKLNASIALRDLRALAVVRGMEIEAPISRRPRRIGAALRRLFRV